MHFQICCFFSILLLLLLLILLAFEQNPLLRFVLIIDPINLFVGVQKQMNLEAQVQRIFNDGEKLVLIYPLAVGSSHCLQVLRNDAHSKPLVEHKLVEIFFGHAAIALVPCKQLLFHACEKVVLAGEDVHIQPLAVLDKPCCRRLPQVQRVGSNVREVVSHMLVLAVAVFEARDALAIVVNVGLRQA